MSWFALTSPINTWNTMKSRLSRIWKLKGSDSDSCLGFFHGCSQMVAKAGVIWRCLMSISGSWAGVAAIASAWWMVSVSPCPAGLSMWLYWASSLHGGLQGVGPLLWSLASVGGGHQEGVTAGWPSSSLQAARGTAPPPPFASKLCSPSPQWEPFQRCTLVGVKHCQDYLNWSSKASMQTFKIWQMGEEIYSSWGTWHSPCMWVLLPITPATCQSGGVCFFFWTLIALCVWGLVSDLPPTPAPREHLNLQANKFCQSVVRERKLLFSHNLGSDMGAVLYHFLCDKTVLEPIWGHRLYLLMGIMSKNVWLSFTCNLC